MTTIIPTVFAHNKKEFYYRFNKVVKISKKIQIDFMDWKFVDSKGISLSDIENLTKYKNKFEAHLMLINPKKLLVKLRNKGFYKVLFHYETIKSIGELKNIINEIKKNKMEAWITFNPTTEINEILEVLDKINGIKGIMLMGVFPGKEHQNINNNIYERIRKIRLFTNLKIHIDGGVNEKNAKKLSEAGADILNSGSFISDSKNPRKALMMLKKAL